MARVQSVGFQVNEIMKELNGVGISKKKTREEGDRIGANGMKTSHLIHSYKSLDNFRADLTNLAKFAKHEYGMKEVKQINALIIRKWLNKKDISYRTASNYISELSKASDYLNCSRKSLNAIREEMKEKLDKPKNITRSYKNLDKIKLKDPKSNIAFKLQRDYGLRVSATTNIPLNNLNNNELTYKEKGGRVNSVTISPQLSNEIKELATDNIFKINNRNYYNYLKKEIEATGQIFNGTHGVRHTFAQKKLEEGSTKQEVSNLMGHFREDVVNTYLR